MESGEGLLNVVEFECVGVVGEFGNDWSEASMNYNINKSLCKEYKLKLTT